MVNLRLIAYATVLACWWRPVAGVETRPSAPAVIAGAFSIQDALNQNPGRLVFLPPGDYVISQPVRITTPNSGLWGPGRIIQSNPDEAVIDVINAAGAQIRDVTLTRASGRNETHQPALRVTRSNEAVVANVQVIDNWSDAGAIYVENSSRVHVRDCVIRNYSRVSIDDRTRNPSRPDMENYGFAFNCINGTGLDFRNVTGALVTGNRIVELRLLPTPQNKRAYRLGTIIKKDAKKGRRISQADWDSDYVNLWRQGAALHVDLGETSDCIEIIGNYIENSQQGLDLHADHMIVANNIIVDTAHGIKVMHGARNVVIVGNQLVRNDLFGIGMMQGTISHAAGHRSLAPVEPGYLSASANPIGANIDGYSIIAHNIVSDFGYGMSHWIWPVNASIGPAPIQLGDSALPDTPPLREVILEGNLVYDPGADQVLINGKPRVEPPRYRFTVRIESGTDAPRRLKFANNLFSPGLNGIISDGKAAADQ